MRSIARWHAVVRRGVEPAVLTADESTHRLPNPSELHTTIKLGIDAHAKWLLIAGICFFIPSAPAPPEARG